MSSMTNTPSSPDGPLPWERFKRPSLAALFNSAGRHAPELAGAKMLGAGSFGLVAGHDDDSVTKITFRFRDEKMDAEAREGAEAEIETLRILSGHAGRLGGLEVPVLLGAPRELPESSPFSHMFRMTRVSGVAGDWYPEKPMPERDRKAYFHEAGAVLARFHDAAASLPLPARRQGEGWTIQPVGHFSGHINEGLAVAKQYLESHAVAGIGHGDFHGGNLMHGPDGRITGLIDFAMTGHLPNRHSDMLAVPDGYLDDFIAGYEDASGIRVDRHVLTAASLGWMTHLARRTEGDPAMQMHVTEKINEALNRLTFVTGYKP